jgi:hypothetical protein
MRLRALPIVSTTVLGLLLGTQACSSTVPEEVSVSTRDALSAGAVAYSDDLSADRDIAAVLKAPHPETVLTDLVWQHERGAVGTWDMVGPEFTGEADKLHVDTSSGERIEATGDLDGNGHTDYLFRATSGQVRVAMMGNKGLQTPHEIRELTISPDPAWHLGAVADLNGDGRGDLVWSHDDGTQAVWLMDGATLPRPSHSMCPRPTGA